MIKARRILIHEPDYLLRRTVVSTARSLFSIDICECTRLDSTWSQTRSQSFDGILLALPDGDEEETVKFLEDLRAGNLVAASDTAVIVMAHTPPTQISESLNKLNVQRLLLKPLKVKHILEGLHEMGAGLLSPARAA